MAKKRQQPQAPRAQRFKVRVALRYRPLGEMAWINGRTQNISRTGVLFFGPRSVAVGTRIQLSLALPLKAKLPLSITVLCRGEVARIGPMKRSSQQIAARFLDSRLSDHVPIAA